MRASVNSLLLVLLLFQVRSVAQSFPLDYLENLSPTWSRPQPPDLSVDPKLDSMMRASTGKGLWEAQMRAEERSARDEVERLERLLAMVGENIHSVQAFTFVEEQPLTPTWPPVGQRGVVILGPVVHCFSFDPITDTIPRIRATYVPDTSAKEGTDAWDFVVQHALRRDVDGLVRLAKAESSANDLSVQPSWQYEIIDYDRRRLRTIEHIFLHETVMSVK